MKHESWSMYERMNGVETMRKLRMKNIQKDMSNKNMVDII